MAEQRLTLEIGVELKDGILQLHGFDAAIKQIVTTTKKATTDVVGGWESVKKSIANVWKQFTAASLAANAMQSIINAAGRAIASLLPLGDSLDEVRNSFHSLASSAGIDAERMLQGMQQASDRLVLKMDLMTTANELLASGLPVTEENMVRLTAAAKALGEAHGVEATRALGLFADALVRGQDRGLMALGVDVDLKAAVDALGGSASEAAKKHSILDAMMAKLSQQMARLSGGSQSAADRLTQLRVAAADAWTEFGSWLNQSPALNIALEGLISVFGNWEGVIAALLPLLPLLVTKLAAVAMAAYAAIGPLGLIAAAATAAGIAVSGWAVKQDQEGLRAIGEMVEATKREHEQLTILKGVLKDSEISIVALKEKYGDYQGILDAIARGALPQFKAKLDEVKQALDAEKKAAEEAASATAQLNFFTDYAREVEEVQKAFKSLSAMQKMEIRYWKEHQDVVGKSLDEYAKGIGVLPGAMKLYVQQLEAEAKAQEEAARRAEDLRKKYEGMARSFGGYTQAVDRMRQAVEGLSDEQRKQIDYMTTHGASAQEISYALEIGAEVVQAYQKQVQATAEADRGWLQTLEDTSEQLGALNPIIGATKVGIGNLALEMTEAEKNAAALHDAMNAFGLVSIDQINQEAENLAENWDAVWKAFQDGKLGADQVLRAWQVIYDFYTQHTLALSEEFGALGESIKRSMSGAAETLGDTVRSALGVLGGALESVLNAWLGGAKSFKDAFVGIFKQAVAEIVKLFLNKTLKNALANLFSGLSGSGSGTGIWDRVVGWVGKTFGNSIWGMIVTVVLKLVSYLPKLFSRMRDVFGKGGEYVSRSFWDKFGEVSLRSLPGGNESIFMFNKILERSPLIAVFQEYGAKLGSVFGESLSKGTAEQILQLISAAFGGLKGGDLEDKIPIGIYLPEVQLLLIQTKLHDLSTQTAEDWARIWTDHTRAVLMNELGKTEAEAAQAMAGMIQAALDGLKKSGQAVGPELANLVVWAAKLGVAFDTTGLQIRDATGAIEDFAKWLTRATAMETFAREWKATLGNLATALDAALNMKNFENRMKAIGNNLTSIFTDLIKQLHELEQAGVTKEQFAAMGAQALPALKEMSQWMIKNVAFMKQYGMSTTQMWESVGAAMQRQLQLMKQLGLEGTAAYKKLREEYEKLKQAAGTIQAVMGPLVEYFRLLGEQGKITGENFEQMMGMALAYIEKMKAAGATAAEILQAMQGIMDTMMAQRQSMIDKLFADWQKVAGMSTKDNLDSLTDQQKKAIEDFLNGVKGAEERLNNLHLPQQLMDQILALKDQISGPAWEKFQEFFKKQKKLAGIQALMDQIKAMMDLMGKNFFDKNKGLDADKWGKDIKSYITQMHKLGMTWKQITSQYGATLHQLYEQYIREGKVPPPWLQSQEKKYEQYLKQQKKTEDAQRGSQIALLEALKAIIQALDGTIPASLNAAINQQKNLQKEADKTYDKMLGKDPTKAATGSPLIKQLDKDTGSALSTTQKYKDKWVLAKDAIHNTTKVGGVFYKLMLGWLDTLTKKTDALRKAFKGSGVYSAIESVRDMGQEFETDLVRNLDAVTGGVVEMENAWSYFGVRTRAELEEIARKSTIYFWDIYNSGQATSSVLADIWKKTAENIIAAGGTLPPEFKAIGDAMGLNIAEPLAKVESAFEVFGVKTRAELETIAQKTMAAFQAVLKSGALTPEELYKAWQQTRDAMVAAGLTLSEDFKKMGADLEITLKKGESGVETLANSTHLASVSMVSSFGKTEDAADKLQKKIDKITKATMALVEAFKIGTETGQINAGNVGSYEQAAFSFLGRLKKAGGSYESILEAAKGFSESLGPLGATAITSYYNTLQAAAPFMAQLGAFQEVVQLASGKLKKHEFVPIATGLVDIYNRSTPLLGGDTIDYMRSALREINKSEDQYRGWYNDVAGFKALMDAAGFARGIRVVPYDMIAKIHEGEKLIPRDVKIATGYDGKVLPWPKEAPGEIMPRRRARGENVDDARATKQVVIPFVVDGHVLGNLVLEIISKANKRGGLDINVRSLSAAS